MKGSISLPRLFPLGARLCSTSFILLLFSSCGGCSLQWEEQDTGNTYTFLSYNVHNLFDDEDAGTEYAEFSGEKGSWGRPEYLNKLENLGKVLRDASPSGADFLAFCEIENARVLEDLVNLQLQRKGYRTYGAVAESGAPTGIGFISRLPVLQSRAHQPVSEGFPQRPILEVEVDCGGHPLTVFICHFKSKTEGAEATEENRIASATVIRKRMRELLEADLSREILILGDLNENINEYERVGKQYRTALLPLEAEIDTDRSLIVASDAAGSERGDDPGVLYSPWLMGFGNKGSYVYRGKWETIDHMLLSRSLLDPPGLAFLTYTVVQPAYALNEAGEPNVSYSDHLPLLLELNIKEE
ncbi:MAG TPA: hypothetical protein PLG79_14850, partial [Spirochaetales bacterium]|nr:hypothetical protein [Spirochaetales bacterium]